MGYQTLDAALSFPQNIPPSGSHILITDTLAASGDFLLHHFISNSIKADSTVCVVGLGQIWNHYLMVGRKLGINLLRAKQSNQIIFIDGLTQLNDYSVERSTATTTLSTPTAILSHPSSLRDIYLIIKQSLGTSPKAPCVILDDLSVLSWLGFGYNDITQLTRALKSLVQRLKGHLITVLHADTAIIEDATENTFIRSILYTADVVIMVEELGSGFSKDVHGQISLIHGPVSTLSADYNYSKFEGKSLHYRVGNNNVVLFAKGFGNGVM